MFRGFKTAEWVDCWILIAKIYSMARQTNLKQSYGFVKNYGMKYLGLMDEQQQQRIQQTMFRNLHKYTYSYSNQINQV